MPKNIFTMLKTASKVTINTGNVLNLIDIKKKAGQNVTEEVSNAQLLYSLINIVKKYFISMYI